MVLEPSAPYCYGTQFMGFGLIPFRSPLLGESKQILHRYNTNSHKYHKLNLCICVISVVINVKSVFYFFFFLRLLRCFNSPGTPLIILCVQITDVPSSTGQVTPFGNPRVKGCLPPNRGLSQAATSFIVFLCRGIHHIHLLKFSHTFVFKSVFIMCLFFDLLLYIKLSRFIPESGIMNYELRNIFSRFIIRDS